MKSPMALRQRISLSRKEDLEIVYTAFDGDAHTAPELADNLKVLGLHPSASECRPQAVLSQLAIHR